MSCLLPMAVELLGSNKTVVLHSSEIPFKRNSHVQEMVLAFWHSHVRLEPRKYPTFTFNQRQNHPQPAHNLCPHSWATYPWTSPKPPKLPCHMIFHLQLFHSFFRIKPWRNGKSSANDHVNVKFNDIIYT